MRTLGCVVVASAAVLAVACSDTGPPRVGCLQKSDAAGGYVLVPIDDAGTMAAAAATENRNGGKLTQFATSDIIPQRSFRVIANKDEDLSAHVNQRVAVEGFIQDDQMAIATGTAAPGQNSTSAGYGSPNFQASPATTGHGSSSQIGTETGSVGTNGYAPTESGSQTVDRVDANRSTEPTSGGGIILAKRDNKMPTLRAESIKKLADSCR